MMGICDRCGAETYRLVLVPSDAEMDRLQARQPNRMDLEQFALCPPCRQETR